MQTHDETQHKMRIDCRFDVKAISDDGRIEGYGAVFGNVDYGMDRIEKGAFREFIRGTKMIPMLWQHYSSEPIGVWDEMREDSKGLRMSGQLNLSKDSGAPDVPRAWEARALAKQGAVTGLSIGYYPVEWKYEEDVRVLMQLDLDEVSLATFPMNPEARVIGVKHMTRVEFCRMLRDRCGLSRSAAEMVYSKGFSALSESRSTATQESGSSASDDKVPDIMARIAAIRRNVIGG